MSRRRRLLLTVSTTVGGTLFLAWIVVQAVVVRPAFERSKPLRVLQAWEAAALLQSGLSTSEIEEKRDIDIRVMNGPAEGPPEGDDWIREDSERGAVWTRDHGDHGVAVWSGQFWLVLQSHPSHAVTLALALFAVGMPLIIFLFGIGQRPHRYWEEFETRLQQMAAGDLNVRLETDSGPKDARRIATAVNHMAVKLKSLVASDRERIAGLSHELRTPLTRMRLELGLARRDGVPSDRLDRVEHDIEVFDSMLRELLDLSQLQLVGMQTRSLETVDLVRLVHTVLQEEGRQGVEVRGEGTANVDRTMVGRLLANLLRNCAQHAPGQRCWVDVTANAVTVGDDGPGIPLARQLRATEAFERGPASRGHGLGLAIVTEIVDLHGGTMSFSAPPGLEVRVQFPPSRQASAMTDGHDHAS